MAEDHWACGRNSIRNRTDLGMLIPVTSKGQIRGEDELEGVVWLTPDLVDSAFEHAPSVGVLEDDAGPE